jgi:hypothetical protein
MVKKKPDYPENVSEGIKSLQNYYKEAVDSRYISSSYDDFPTHMANLHTQLAILGTMRPPKLKYGQENNPAEPYSLQIAEIMFEIIRLANSSVYPFDLAEAMKVQEEQHDILEKKREKKAKKQQKKWYDSQPKYHAEGSGKNPLRADGLYGKAAQAADGDWYSSH